MPHLVPRSGGILQLPGHYPNLAKQLFHKGDLAGAREQAEKALEFPLSEHGQQVAVDLIQKPQ